YTREGIENALDVGGVRDRAGHKLDRERRRHGVCGAQEVIIAGVLGVGQQSHPRDPWCNLLEHRQPLAEDARLDVQHAGSRRWLCWPTPRTPAMITSCAPQTPWR